MDMFLKYYNWPKFMIDKRDVLSSHYSVSDNTLAINIIQAYLGRSPNELIDYLEEEYESTSLALLNTLYINAFKFRNTFYLSRYEMWAIPLYYRDYVGLGHISFDYETLCLCLLRSGVINDLLPVIVARIAKLITYG